jgi:hypothetical protein
MPNVKAEPWPTQAIQASRLLRPYPVRRLTEALHHVEQTSGTISQNRLRLMVDTPVSPDEWAGYLAEIQDMLETLAEQCGDAWERLQRMIDSAPADHRRALDALVLILRGLSAPQEAEEASTPLAA